MENIKIVIYKRVSTKEQGNSNLGLLAQQRDINYKIHSLKRVYNVEILETFKEIGSGKNLNTRLELQKAIKLCKKEGAYLLVQKIDRLSRNIQDGINIFTDLNRKIFFSNIETNDIFLISILLAQAQKEREIISERTTKALRELKEQGMKLGRQKGSIKERETKIKLDLMLKARQEKSLNYYSQTILPLIKDYLKQNKTYQFISKKLNMLGFKSIRGNNFSYTSIKKLIFQYELNNKKSWVEI